MRPKKIIPRRDHEVYFILTPPELPKNRFLSFVFDKLEELHPGFSAATVYDMQVIVFNKRRWIMATVMENETFAEYKILNKGVVLYTNTSIMVHGKEFVTGGIVAVDDERIGFDGENDQPVSVPQETEINSGSCRFDHELRYIPSRYGVFNKKALKPPVVCAAVVFLVALFLLFVFTRKAQEKDTVQITHAEAVEAVKETKYMPSAALILSAVSEKTVESGGEIARWHYNENAEPFIMIQFTGMEPLTVHAMFSGMDYLTLEDIQDIRYTEGVSYFTAFLNSRKDSFCVPQSSVFPAQKATLALITDMTDTFKRQEITVVSETLPAASNGNAFYTVTYTAEDWNFIRSLEILEYACDSSGLRITILDVSINSDKSTFTVVCTLSYHTGINIVSSLGDERYLIPVAFGYTTEIQSSEIQFESPPGDAIPPVEPPVIGSIRDESGKTVYYRDADGKIKTRGER